MNMSKLYIITGPAGVGKSTISKKIAEKSKKSALIEGDDIYHFVCGGYISPWKEGNHLKIFWKNCIDIIRNFLDSGYDVVFNYIVSKQKIEELKQAFRDVEIKFIVLIVDKQTIVKRDAMRPEDCQMKERCLTLLENTQKQNFNKNNILDTSNLSVEETVNNILEEDRFILQAQETKRIEKYYDNTQSNLPRKNVKYFIDNIECELKNAIELGCGAGNDTVYLIKNNWNVVAIDREDVEARISKRLSEQEKEKFIFQKQNFETLKIEKTNLIVANNCLSFCNNDKFKEMWNKINESIVSNGYFVGNFFGVEDSWNGIKTEMRFFTKKQVMELFNNFEIIRFEEIEKDGLTGLGYMKHWHIFDVVARKREKGDSKNE